VVTGAECARWVGIVAATIAAIAFLPWIYGGNRSRMAHARD
jgi:hypothetical protein